MKTSSILFTCLLMLLIGISCSTSKQQDESLSSSCCKECWEAFSQSPAAASADGLACGDFTTAKPISQACRDYFTKNPKMVADCKNSN